MQHPSATVMNHPMFESLRKWSHASLRDEMFPLEWTIAAMDDAGVAMGLLCGWWAPSGPLISNAEVARAVERYPDRFVGVASVNLFQPMHAVRELRRCVGDLGFKALRIVPWLWDLPPDDRHYYPLYAECVELGIPFCTQVGHTGPLRHSEPGRPIPYLDNVALDFPELVIVGGHIGYPWTSEMIAIATRYPNVYIDTSAYKVTRYPPELVTYLRGQGKHKVLFGSNHPAWPATQCLGGLDQLGLDDATKTLFLRGNALRVFGLGQSHARK
ncbi:amidohydrolase [Mycobacterium kansasii]|nr:amidohydrolase [Mycobacterium kansasii]